LDGGVLALSGDLGSGKTTFSQGFAQGLKINDRIVSPTFLIIRQYPVPGKKNYFYHIDLYRMENIDLKNSGLEEILSEPSNVVLIEWADKILEYLPETVKRIYLKKVSGDEHEITIKD
jgi:tRNA threonylcarbamoyladenosine biosynthesis protein TsaE